MLDFLSGYVFYIYGEHFPFKRVLCSLNYQDRKRDIAVCVLQVNFMVSMVPEVHNFLHAVVGYTTQIMHLCFVMIYFVFI